jgi:hypothetical protein
MKITNFNLPCKLKILCDKLIVLFRCLGNKTTLSALDPINGPPGCLNIALGSEMTG